MVTDRNRKSLTIQTMEGWYTGFRFPSEQCENYKGFMYNKLIEKIRPTSGFKQDSDWFPIKYIPTYVKILSSLQRKNYEKNLDGS